MDYISASQVNRFLECSLAYKYIYVDSATKVPSNEYFSFGTALHKALEENFRQKITSRKDLPLKEIRHIFTKTFELEISKGVILSNPFFVRNTMFLQWEVLLDKYMNTIWKDVYPAYVEHKFELYLKVAPIKILGYIDLITEDWEIVDYKTAWTTTYKKYTQKFVDNMTQLTMYSLAFRKEFGRPEKNLRIDLFKRLKTTQDISQIKTQRTDINILSLVELMKKMQIIKDNDLYYPNYNSCSSCDFRNNCNKI